MLRSALVVAVPEAAPMVDGWRERGCADKPSIGVPPHVTLLFPFVPAQRIDDDLLAELKALFSGFDAFPVAFTSSARFPTVLYLAPAPPDPFRELTEAIVARYPDYPPYEGAFDEIVPHLTVAHGDAQLLDAAAADVEPKLPLRLTAREVVLLEEVEADWGRWIARAAFPLGSGQ